MTDAEIKPDALEIWRKKLSFLQAQEAKESDANTLFKLQMEIEKARRKINELSAGFEGGEDDVRWRHLCRHVRGGEFIPILGSGLAAHVCHNAADTARHLAKAHGFPLAQHQRDDLPRVLQYISVKEGPSAVLPELREQWLRQIRDDHHERLSDEEREQSLPKLMDAVGERCRAEDENEPHRVLAGLPASIYVTANYDNLLYRALQGQDGRQPQRLVCQWREDPPLAPPHEDEPSPERPLLYHILGFLGTEDSLVLTEDDHFDYLIATATHQLVPTEVKSALVDSSLLFLGFQLTDWSFRVLFRLIQSLEGRDRLKDYPHVAVQVDPSSGGFTDAAGARAYLQRYFGGADIDVYWGGVERFLKELQEKLDTLPADPRESSAGTDEEWD